MHSIRRPLAFLACAALLGAFSLPFLTSTSHGATATERRTVQAQFNSQKDGSETGAISSSARSIIGGGNIIMDGSTGYLVNPSGANIPFRDQIVNSAPANGGNAGVANSYTGIVNSSLIPIATLTNGTATAKTKALMDDTPAAEFSALTLVGAQPTITQDSTIYRVGTKSLKLAFTAAAAAADGVQWTAFAAEDWTTEESVGFWVYSTATLSAGDITFTIVDSTADHAFNFPACAKNTWTWCEIDISVLATTDGDAVTNYKIKLTSQGATALGAFDLYLDGGYKWDSTEEVALGVDLVDSPGAVRSVLTFQKAATGNSDATAIVPVAITEGTDYFIAWRSGNDSLVTITDQSTKSAFALVNHK